MNYKEILDYPMQHNDAEARTIGEYLILLLSAVWEEGECFSGKRPFGNSGWYMELYIALVKGGFVKGSFYEHDEDEEYYELKDYDRHACDKLVFELIQSLYEVK